MAMGGEKPRSPQMVREMDGSSELQLYPAAPSHLYGKTKSKLGVIDTKGQIAAEMKSDDAKVPEYVWDVRALRLERPLKEVEKNFRYASWCYVDMVEADSCEKSVQVCRDAFGKLIDSRITNDTLNPWKVPLLRMGDSRTRVIPILVSPG
jgi:hypothetical protein